MITQVAGSRRPALESVTWREGGIWVGREPWPGQAVSCIPAPWNGGLRLTTDREPLGLQPHSPVSSPPNLALAFQELRPFVVVRATKVMVRLPCLLFMNTSTSHSHTRTFCTPRPCSQKRLISRGALIVPKTQEDGVEHGHRMGEAATLPLWLPLTASSCVPPTATRMHTAAHHCWYAHLFWVARQNGARPASELYDLTVLDRSCRPHTSNTEDSDS